MKTLVYGLALSVATLATSAAAELSVTVNGEEVSVAQLMDNCKTMTDQPEAQVACFSAISQLLEKQSGDSAEGDSNVGQALANLQQVAQFENGETGLMIDGSGCTIQMTYFANYFHVSRRNVSSIDLHHAQFDVSRLRLDEVSSARARQDLLTTGVMEAGGLAAMRGGVALESTTHNFAPKSARASIGEYASKVVPQLPAQEADQFSFVLVHPALGGAREDIWNAFEAYVKACQG